MKRIPTMFGSVKCVFTLAILLLTAGSATAQNEATLPAPTGSHKIGRASFHWKDSARAGLRRQRCIEPGDKIRIIARRSLVDVALRRFDNAFDRPRRLALEKLARPTSLAGQPHRCSSMARQLARPAFCDSGCLAWPVLFARTEP